MDIIPVLDLARGVAVHARAGHRARYEPVRSVLAPKAEGDPLTLLREFRAALGTTTCYVADLDAVQGGAVQRRLLHELARVEHGTALLVDAGTTEAGRAREVLACGASRVVVGLESLRAFGDLANIVREVGAVRVVFSLDLRLGSPVVHPGLDAAARRADALDLATLAAEVGVGGLLMLDIGRVGTGCGVDLGLLASLRRRFTGSWLAAGGGVRSRRDLDRMRDTGCDAALVASAIHGGLIGAADVAALADQSGTSDSR